MSDHTFGIHYYQDRLGCLRRACAGTDDSSEDSEFGSQIHEWLKCYHTQSGSCAARVALSDVTPLTKDGKARGCSEAELARRYEAKVPSIVFGFEPLLVEQRLQGSLGGAPIAGTLDLVVKLREAEVELVRATWGLTIEPGTYLVDHKTKARRSSEMYATLARSAQFPFYHELWRQNYGEPLSGSLANMLIRTTAPADDAFALFHLPLPEEDDLKRCLTIVREASSREAALGRLHCTPTRCYDFGRECPELGSCPRHNEA
jgi:hypothetical protein